ncbi:hypothetical protein HanPI659440_Chr10g0369101 [Helianthus annuus]|nr:hypothetical protein HanPI659440_Chr10g0369101 [Helianthus annuus]
MGFFFFALRNTKKILISPPKSFHDWKMKFFYIHAEVTPMAKQFRNRGPIPKEDVAIPRGAAWYENLLALLNRVFGEQILVAVGMSEKWSKDSENILVLLLEGEETALYQGAFFTFAGVMGTRPLRDGEEFWSEQMRPNFMHARLEAFATPPIASEGACIPNPMLCRAVTSAGKRDCLSFQRGVSRFFRM